MVETFNVWVYLAQVAPVVLVLGLGVCALWKRVCVLTDELKELIREGHEREKQTHEAFIKVLALLEDVKERLRT